MSDTTGWAWWMMSKNFAERVINAEEPTSLNLIHNAYCVQSRYLYYSVTLQQQIFQEV